MVRGELDINRDRRQDIAIGERGDRGRVRDEGRSGEDGGCGGRWGVKMGGEDAWTGDPCQTDVRWTFSACSCEWRDCQRGIKQVAWQVLDLFWP